MAKPRDTLKYTLRQWRKIVHKGITDDLERRETQHQQKFPGSKITQIGRRTTEEAARQWEKDQGVS